MTREIHRKRDFIRYENRFTNKLLNNIELYKFLLYTDIVQVPPAVSLYRHMVNLIGPLREK
jgi:hypothetical protein